MDEEERASEKTRRKVRQFWECGSAEQERQEEGGGGWADDTQETAAKAKTQGRQKVGRYVASRCRCPGRHERNKKQGPWPQTLQQLTPVQKVGAHPSRLAIKASSDSRDIDDEDDGERRSSMCSM